MSEPSAAGGGGDDGRGGAGGRGGGRKGRFMPTVPSRRKKEDATATRLEGAAGGDDFKELLKAAQSGPSEWNRGGRGRGRGAQANAQPKMVVTFGGNDSRPALAAAKQPKSKVKQEGGDGAGPSGARGTSLSDAPVRSRAGAGAGGAAGPSNAQGASEPILAPARVKAEPRKGAVGSVLDLHQYYPTTLPLRPPPHLEETYPEMVEYEEEGEGGPGTAPEVAQYQDTAAAVERPCLSAAADLRLAEAAETARLFLVQLPSVLAVPSTKDNSKTQHGKERDRHRGKEEAGTSSGAGGEGTSGAQEASSLRDLPEGVIGKLLVFKSGKVKMQMGDVLMDVAAGTICQHRQDALAISMATSTCVFLGEVAQRMVVSPDIWQLLSNDPTPQWSRELKTDGVSGAPHTDGDVHMTSPTSPSHNPAPKQTHTDNPAAPTPDSPIKTATAATAAAASPTKRGRTKSAIAAGKADTSPTGRNNTQATATDTTRTTNAAQDKAASARTRGRAAAANGTASHTHTTTEADAQEEGEREGPMAVDGEGDLGEGYGDGDGDAHMADGDREEEEDFVQERLGRRSDELEYDNEAEE